MQERKKEIESMAVAVAAVVRKTNNYDTNGTTTAAVAALRPTNSTRQ